MKQLAVIGKPEFTLGFKLTGIREVIDTLNPKEDIAKILQNENYGIIILDPEIMADLDEYTKEQVVTSINPVFVVVSKEASQDELRKMIIQSIGVDLMKENN